MVPSLLNTTLCKRLIARHCCKDHLCHSPRHRIHVNPTRSRVPSDWAIRGRADIIASSYLACSRLRGHCVSVTVCCRWGMTVHSQHVVMHCFFLGPSWQMLSKTAGSAARMELGSELVVSDWLGYTRCQPARPEDPANCHFSDTFTCRMYVGHHAGLSP